MVPSLWWLAKLERLQREAGTTKAATYTEGLKVGTQDYSKPGCWIYNNKKMLWVLRGLNHFDFNPLYLSKSSSSSSPLPWLYPPEQHYDHACQRVGFEWQLGRLGGWGKCNIQCSAYLSHPQHPSYAMLLMWTHVCTLYTLGLLRIPGLACMRGEGAGVACLCSKSNICTT